MTYNIEFFLEFEAQLLINKLSESYSLDSTIADVPSEKVINNTFQYVHAEMINCLINYFMQEKCKEYKPSLYSDFFEGSINEEICLPVELKAEIVPDLCEKLHEYFLNSSFTYTKGKISRKKSKNNLLEVGAVYTQDNTAYDIVHRTLKNIPAQNLQTIKILDFATGTGRFYRQIVKCLYEIFGLKPDYTILNNIYAVDIDAVALNICRVNALNLLTVLNCEKAKVVSEHVLYKNALVKEQLFEDSLAISYKDLNGLFFNGFDAVVSNPPYLVLKPNKNKMDIETVENITSMAKYFRSSNFYKYSIEGMLNLYQISLEAMLGMLKDGGEMGVICPSTLFADISTSVLRKHLLSKHNITYIKYFSEEEQLFNNVTQATCIFHLTKGGICSFIDIAKGEKEYQIALSDVKQVFSTNWEIPSIEKIEWDILRKLLAIPTLKQHSNIRNKRGELDLSLFKEYITKDVTTLRLVRGNMISDNCIIDTNKEYVRLDFLDKKSKDYLFYDKGRRRLVCQQISNMSQRVRLRFVECDTNDILGNSCNYITVAEDQILKMKAILNSSLLNWRFKITSTNNHINNYELDELPIINLDTVPSDIIGMDDISRNIKICSLYGLENDEINFIINQ